ncbi:MAG: hypothetical protein ACI35S_05330 [Anaeroplasma sp.]
MTLNNFRIIRLDSCNLTFEEYKTVSNNKNGIKTTSTKWIRVGGYYGNMGHCLDGLKNYIISTYAEIDNYQEVLDKVNALNRAIVECKLYEVPEKRILKIADEDL